MKTILFLIFFMVIGLVVKSQPYYFRHYQVEQGLSHNSVTSSLQDNYGFVWFGTKDGLNRFDGYTFKVFRTDPEDTAGIGSNFILSLCENRGKLWVGTDNGLYQYDEKTESFSLLPVSANSYIRGIEKDSNGNLWFIAGHTLYRYNESEQAIKAFDHSPTFNATSMCFDLAGNLWVSTASGTLNKYVSDTESFISYDLFEHSRPTASRWIEKIYGTAQHSILVGTQSQGIKLFDVAETDYKDVLSNDPDNSGLYVRDFVKNTDKEYWVATESGIYILDLNKGILTNLRKSYNDPYSLSDNAVYTLSKDREGGIWAGTYFGGINYYPKQYTSFEKFFPKIGENSISGNAVREICKDQYGQLWIGTEDAGLNKYDPQTGIFTNFKPTGDKNTIAHYNIHGLLATGNELWVGTFHQGLNVLDVRTGEVIRHYSTATRPGSLKNDFIYSILQNPAGDIFVGTSAGIYQYQPEGDDFKTLTAFPETYHYTVMLEDVRGTIWAGTYMDGIFYYNPRTKEKGFYRNDSKDSNSLSSDAVNGIFEDSRQHLWFATANGLNKFDPRSKQFKRYTIQDGLPSNVTYRVLEDNEQKLWISTSKGLVNLDPATNEMMVYTKVHGLLSDQLNYSSSYKDERGRMYFGTVKGLISFDHTHFVNNNFVPPIYLTGFQVQNQELAVNKNDSPLQESITVTDKVTLNYNQSSFSLDFAALSYTAPEMAEYAYKMEGLDNDWTYLKTNRKVFFTELPPGDYTFMVKASNSSGVWNEKATALHIEILPPFWATTWAYLLYSLLAALLISYIFYTYHRRAEKKNAQKIRLLENEKEKEIYQAKIEFFTNIAHEIRTPLTLIKGPLEKILRTGHDAPEINDSLGIMEKNTNRLLDLVNQLLDFRKTETKGISLSYTNTHVADLIQETFLRFKPAAEQKQLNFKLVVPEAAVCAYVDREALTKILSNLFDNALKYADKNVEVCLSMPEQDDEHFTVTIKNDGNLITGEEKEKIFTPFYRIQETESKPGTGIGLPLSRSLAELHNGSLELKEPEYGFNVFVLQLPVHQDKEYKLYDEQPASVTEAINNAHPSASSPSVLLVEDNVEMLEFIGAELIPEYNIFKATDGNTALQILSKETIQLVVSDITMSAMNGIELCRLLKSNIEYSHIPVILLTARTNLQSKIEGLESGVDAYMEKPFSPEHLRVQIANLLTNKSKIKDFFNSSPLTHIRSIAYSKADESFLEELNEAIHKNIADTDLHVEQLADIMNMSRPTLYRKIKAISDLTPNELINLARLKKAAELLAEGDYKIYEIASIVGYKSQTSFGRNFLKQFGMKPSEYAQAKKVG